MNSAHVKQTKGFLIKYRDVFALCVASAGFLLLVLGHFSPAWTVYLRKKGYSIGLQNDCAYETCFPITAKDDRGALASISLFAGVVAAIGIFSLALYVILKFSWQSRPGIRKYAAVLFIISGMACIGLAGYWFFAIHTEYMHKKDWLANKTDWRGITAKPFSGSVYSVGNGWILYLTGSLALFVTGIFEMCSFKKKIQRPKATRKMRK